MSSKFAPEGKDWSVGSGGGRGGRLGSVQVVASEPYESEVEESMMSLGQAGIQERMLNHERRGDDVETC